MKTSLFPSNQKVFARFLANKFQSPPPVTKPTVIPQVATKKH